MPRILVVCVVCMLHFCEPSKSVAEPKTITMSLFVTPEASARARLQELIYTEAFKRLGYQFKLRLTPVARGSDDANKGVTDGEGGRRKNHNLKYPNLLRVEESVYTYEFAAFTIRRDLKLKGWESLKGGNYRIDFIRGSEFIQERAGPYVNSVNFTILNTPEQGLQRLARKRTDLFIFDELDLKARINKTEFEGLIVSAGIMEEIPAYGFLNIKHRDLVEPLAKVLRDMKKEGLIQKFMAQTLSK